MSSNSSGIGFRRIPKDLLPEIFFMSGNANVSLVCRDWHRCCNHVYYKMVFIHLNVANKVPTVRGESRETSVKRLYRELHDRMAVLDRNARSCELSRVEEIWENLDLLNKRAFLRLLKNLSGYDQCDSSEQFVQAMHRRRREELLIQDPGLSRIPFEIQALSWTRINISCFTLGGSFYLQDDRLTSFRVRYCRMRVIRIEASNLRGFDVSSNSLTVLNVPASRELKTVLAFSNAITEVGFLGDNYPQLRKINLNTNRLRLLALHPYRFPNLMTLHLCNNHLRFFPLTEHEELQELHLDHNEIQHVARLFFPRLKILSLKGNQIATMEGRHYLPEIISVDISENPCVASSILALAKPF